MAVRVPMLKQQLFIMNFFFHFNWAREAENVALFSGTDAIWPVDCGTTTIDH